VLDPADWERFRASAHAALDDAIDFLRDARERPAWTPVPEQIKERLRSGMPEEPCGFEAAYREFKETILPYATGNVHPRWWGWVHGSGTPGGAIAELLAAVMNSNVGGREHAAVYVERQVIGWVRDLFGFPGTAGGIMTAGTSVANLIAVLVARTWALGREMRDRGLAFDGSLLTGYATAATHPCVRRAFEITGLGGAQLRIVPCDADRMDTASAARQIAADRERGFQPFIIAGTAGTVDTGAVDPLADIAALARREHLWFHVDGAFGAAAYLSEALRGKLRGIESADSIAFDFHKWLHVPYDAGCVLIRDGAMHQATFANDAPYLTRMQRGAAAGHPWFVDFGPDLSRGFRALKVWFTIKEHGARRLAAAIERNCEQARYLEKLISVSQLFELAAPVELQIVCFRPRLGNMPPAEADAITDEAVIRLQESGDAVISTTTIRGRRAMRACVTNHRTQERDLDLLLSRLTAIVSELSRPSRVQPLGNAVGADDCG
jgi:glutamate/tyrosine decarboxylase-like PLP-dependent enzyme